MNFFKLKNSKNFKRMRKYIRKTRKKCMKIVINKSELYFEKCFKKNILYFKRNICYIDFLESELSFI